MSKENKILPKLDTMSEEELEELHNKAFRDVQIGYELMNAADIIFRRAKDYLEGRKSHLHHAEKYKATRQFQLIEAAIKDFDIHADSTDHMFYQEFPGENIYDAIRRNAYEVVRLIQLYHDRCADPEKAEKVCRYLQRFKSRELFTDDELRINMK